ncbi:class I SAM-dependent methyltransferase [Tahibacter amnicola]|uniref:Class I SAM-dependent methyltransferase n=1 Tax=Tahibacter amnicola TaxID=2976241 RepID=A0ABY6B825_9GAMM|nr:class I SAM-dependent methyltransferase [Tahibacter amnicola]UXI65927.1 class I SAM-dependent methyltransferase [Tahibacter amnicola]
MFGDFSMGRGAVEMKKSGALAADDIHKFWHSIFLINSGHAVASDEAKQACKEAIKALYDFGSRNLHDGMVWNWGCSDAAVDARIKKSVPLYDAVSSDGFSEQLYCFALNAIGLDDLSDKRVLDVGCGFGEGLNFASRVFGFQNAVGLDLCRNAIDRANARLSRPGLLFVCGDAEELPFDDGELDIVVNIESSHTYPDLSRFLKEVARVLRPGGYFSHVDLFTDDRYRQFVALKPESGLEWLAETDITDRVKEAIRARMRPGSFLRRALAKQQRDTPMLLRMLSGSLALANFGADFAGHQYTRWERLMQSMFVRMLKRSGSLQPVRFTRYLHHLARKV